mgnify:CR=1 FL=1
MVLRWYLILLAIGFIGIVIICIIDKEQEKGGPFEERKNLAFLGKFLNSYCLYDIILYYRTSFHFYGNSNIRDTCGDIHSYEL